jgi:hypothetical protein
VAEHSKKFKEEITMFLIYRTDDNGSPYLDTPIGKVELTPEEASGDWLEVKEKAIDKFVEENPDFNGNRGWLEAIEWTKEEVIKERRNAYLKYQLWDTFSR